MNLFYHAIFLTSEDKYYLSSLMSSHIPNEWNMKCHHTTIAFHTDLDSSSAWTKTYFENWMQQNINQSVVLKATAIGFTEKAIALKIDMPSFPCLSGNPHLTIAVAPKCSASASRAISIWTPLEAPINLIGIVGSIHK